jgi:hypothetical protein
MAHAFEAVAHIVTKAADLSGEMVEARFDGPPRFLLLPDLFDHMVIDLAELAADGAQPCRRDGTDGALAFL